MANTRLVLANLARNTGGTHPKICNGDGAYVGAPTRVEVAGFPMENFLSGNKATPWVIPAGVAGGNNGVDLLVDIDFGAPKTFAAVAQFGVSKNTGFPSSYILSVSPSGAYNPASYVAIDTVVIPASDGGKVLLAPTTGRFMRLNVTFAGNASVDWSFGNLFTCAPFTTTDLGVNPSYGYSETLAHQVARARTIGGVPVRTFMGEARKRWTLPFRSIQTAAKDKLVSAFSSKLPITYVTHEDKLYEVIPVSDSISCEQVFMDLWNVTLELEQS